MQSQEKIDQILAALGGFGPYQRFQYALLCLVCFCQGFHTMINVWMAYVPDKYRCYVPPGLNATSGCSLSAGNNTGNCTRSRVDDGGGQCTYYTGGNGGTAETPVPCTQFVYDSSVFEYSAAMQYDLVCDRKLLNGVWQSAFMAGFLVGSFLSGAVSDRIGRKKVLMASIVLQLAIGILTVFMPEYYSFASMRFLMAATDISLFITAFVMTVEMCSESVRVAAGIGTSMCWVAGYVALAPLAYWTGHWQTLQITVTLVPGLLLLAHFWLVTESIRWLILNGRLESAERVIRKAARMNRVDLPEWIFDKDSWNEDVKQEESKSTIDLFRTPKIRARILYLAFNWFVNSLVYYGLSLGSGNLAGDKYVNFFLLAVSDVPGLITALLTMKYLGRRWSLCMALIVGGSACILTYPARDSSVAVVLLSMVGKVCIAGSFGIVYNFTAELFPTQLRNNAMGVSSVSARIGGISAPLIAQLDGHITSSGASLRGFPPIFFGSCSLLAGLLTLLLPETKGRLLPQTVDDVELEVLETTRNDHDACKVKSDQSNDAKTLDKPMALLTHNNVE